MSIGIFLCRSVIGCFVRRVRMAIAKRMCFNFALKKCKLMMPVIDCVMFRAVLFWMLDWVVFSSILFRVFVRPIFSTNCYTFLSCRKLTVLFVYRSIRDEIWTTSEEKKAFAFLLNASRLWAVLCLHSLVRTYIRNFNFLALNLVHKWYFYCFLKISQTIMKIKCMCVSENASCR